VVCCQWRVRDSDALGDTINWCHFSITSFVKCSRLVQNQSLLVEPAFKNKISFEIRCVQFWFFTMVKNSRQLIRHIKNCHPGAIAPLRPAPANTPLYTVFLMCSRVGTESRAWIYSNIKTTHFIISISRREEKHVRFRCRPSRPRVPNDIPEIVFYMSRTYTYSTPGRKQFLLPPLWCVRERT